MRLNNIDFKRIETVVPYKNIDKIFKKIIIISSLIFIYILISIICTILAYTAQKYSYSDQNYDYYTTNVAQINAAFTLSVIDELLAIALSVSLFLIYLKYVKSINKTMKEYNIYAEFRKTISLIVPIFILGISCPIISIIILPLYIYGPLNQTAYILSSTFIGPAEIALIVIFIVLFAKSINRRRDLEKVFNEK